MIRDSKSDGGVIGMKSLLGVTAKGSQMMENVVYGAL